MANKKLFVPRPPIWKMDIFGFTCDNFFGYPPPPNLVRPNLVRSTRQTRGCTDFCFTGMNMPQKLILFSALTQKLLQSLKLTPPSHFQKSGRLMNRSHKIFAVAIGALFGIAGLPTGVPTTLAEDFRVDNTAFVANQKEPPTQSTTIFHNGAVYDFMTAPAETVVFDRPAGRFILLSTSSRTRAELTTDELAAFADRIQQLAGKSPDPLVRFLAAPKFQERFDPSAGELSLGSVLVTYRLTLSSETNPTEAEQYHEFSDWYARLNALLTPGSRPPFARLVVNSALARHKALPSQVVLTLSSSKPNRQPITMHSTHRLIHSLTAADLDRVAKARELMAGSKLVTFEQYRKQEMR